MRQLHMSARACSGLGKSPPHPQTGPNHRRPGQGDSGRPRFHRDGASGRGDSISSKTTALTRAVSTPTSNYRAGFSGGLGESVGHCYLVDVMGRVGNERLAFPLEVPA
jgi:hypothetical protein